MIFHSLILVVILNNFALCIGDDIGCTIDNSYSTKSAKDEAQRNLDRLKGLYGQEYSVSVDQSAYTFKVCGDTVDDDQALKYSTITQKKGGFITSLGRRNQTLVTGGNNWVMLTFLGGKKYNSTCNNIERYSHVLFVCSKHTYEAKFNITEESNKAPDCHYMFTVEHNIVCTIEIPGLGSGTIFFIIVFVGFLCYFIFGFCYRRFVVGAKGVEQIPHREFWMKTGNMFANCCDMMCRCDRYCDSSDTGYISTPGSVDGYTPIGDQPRMGNPSLNSDTTLISP